MTKCQNPRDLKLIRTGPTNLETYYIGEKLLVPLKNFYWDFDFEHDYGWIPGRLTFCLNFSCYDNCISAATEAEKMAIIQKTSTNMGARETDLVFSLTNSYGHELNTDAVAEIFKLGQKISIGNIYYIMIIREKFIFFQFSSAVWIKNAIISNELDWKEKYINTKGK